MWSKSRRAAIAAFLISGAGLNRTAEACAVCLGDPNAELSRSANAGAVALLVVSSLMLAAVGGITALWAKRARDESAG